MRGYIGILADLFSAIVALAATAGLVLFLIGGLAAVEVNSAGDASPLRIFVSADGWAGKLQAGMLMGSAKLFGSHALLFGMKLLGGAIVGAVIVDIMYSLRVLATQTRR